MNINHSPDRLLQFALFAVNFILVYTASAPYIFIVIVSYPNVLHNLYPNPWTGSRNATNRKLSQQI